MMRLIKGFWADRRGGALEKMGLLVGFVALTAVGVSSMLDRMIREGTMPQVAILHSDGKQTIILGDQKQPPRPSLARAAPGVDYSPVASIDKMKIDPCTGERKK